VQDPSERALRLSRAAAAAENRSHDIAEYSIEQSHRRLLSSRSSLPHAPRRNAGSSRPFGTEDRKREAFDDSHRSYSFAGRLGNGSGRGAAPPGPARRARSRYADRAASLS